MSRPDPVLSVRIGERVALQAISEKDAKEGHYYP
jgi:hypothetical protein